MDFTAQFIVYISPLRPMLEKGGERFLEKSAQVVTLSCWESFGSGVGIRTLILVEFLSSSWL